MPIPALDALADRAVELGPTGAPEYEGRHWRLTRDAEGIAWLLLDRAGESANTISAEVLTELAAALDAVEASRPRALVLRSAKPNGFAAGADIRDFADLGTTVEVSEKLAAAHRIVDRLAALPFPTVAVIHGYCLGGGLEIALACRHRLAVPGAKLGFPEVMLGLHPGLGGTFRLTGLIDSAEAMKLMLTGRSVDAQKARALGLVDAVAEERHVAAALRAAADDGLKSRTRGLKAGVLGTAPARTLAARRMRQETEKRAPKANYPAPTALIDLWENHGGDPAAMQRGEIASFAELLPGDTAQNLIRVFFLRERLKALGKADAAPARVHVVGAGTMGGEIAAWCALQGVATTLTDLDPETVAKTIGRANAIFEDKLDGTARRDARDRLTPDFAGDGAAAADIVIEAIAEMPEAKRKLYAEIEPRMKPEAVLASNTSSIPLESLRDGLARPERLVGLHFFNPVSKMQLVEVVAHEAAAEDALAAARALCGRIDRLPAPVASAPGFLVNRVLTPYLLEAMLLLDEGAKPEAIDRAATDFGMAQGPVEVADRVGLDICLAVLDSLRERLDPPWPEPPAWLREKVDKGELGTKTGKGLYDWSDDRPNRPDADPDPALTDRLILPMVNTAAACLREQIVADDDLLDAAMIFATGFAPFRGGPAKYARDRGIPEVRDRLGALTETHGPRFRPDPGLDALGTPE